MIRVLVVDDHDLVRTGITRMLEDNQDIQVVGQAQSGEEAIKQVQALNPDIVLMDIRMPGMGGLEATQRIRKRFENTRVIAVTACDDDIYPTRFIEAGATGYITKGTGFAEMLQAIKQVHLGKPYLSAEIAQQMAMRSFQPAAQGSPFDELSQRELQICIMIANGDTANDIADVLCLSPKTINTYRYRAFEKLNVKTDVEMTLLAIRHHLVNHSTGS
ncbi:response regulator [Pseudomonas sp. F1_0610]|uniref:response regulator n=1 Tax=Pseudomonas sp. F1_0610 TaxID=3114284 RepID=UPI0039C4B080